MVNTWQIDSDGLVFHNGKPVMRIERAPEHDGMIATAYRALGVEVRDPNDVLGRPTANHRVIGSSRAVVMDIDTWRNTRPTVPPPYRLTALLDSIRLVAADTTIDDASARATIRNLIDKNRPEVNTR